MNFLMTITYKDSWYALPQEKRSEIVGQVVAYHEKYLKEGKKLGYAFFAIHEKVHYLEAVGVSKCLEYHASPIEIIFSSNSFWFIFKYLYGCLATVHAISLSETTP